MAMMAGHGERKRELEELEKRRRVASSDWPTMARRADFGKAAAEPTVKGREAQ
uniref:Uncharacterized protein n=1 Tax=Oryza sativa subsp. japonica TaxID=39947 RepID=Q6YSU1_ORYSJ|nr:hypothetical protein [Oryza sativa Japonica Group]